MLHLVSEVQTQDEDTYICPCVSDGSHNKDSYRDICILTYTLAHRCMRFSWKPKKNTYAHTRIHTHTRTQVHDVLVEVMTKDTYIYIHTHTYIHRCMLFSWKS